MAAYVLRGCGTSAGGPFRFPPSRHGSPLGLRVRGRPPPRCQGGADSSDYVDGQLEPTKGSSGEVDDDDSDGGGDGDVGGGGGGGRDVDVDGLREALQRSRNDLAVARLNSTMFEGKAQRISESAIALKDRADSAQRDVSAAVAAVQEVIGREGDAKEAVRRSTMALSMAEARLQLAAEALDAKRGSVGPMEVAAAAEEEEEEGVEEESLASAQEDIRDCRAALSRCEEELRLVQERKMELQREVDRLTELAEKALLDASKAEEDVANIMVLAEQAVALEMEAAQRANDAELALQKAERAISSVDTVVELTSAAEEQKKAEEDGVSEGCEYSSDGADDVSVRDEVSNTERIMVSDLAVEGIEQLEPPREVSDEASSDKTSVEPQKEADPDVDKSKQGKKQETERKKETTLLKRSSRFFSASFFSSQVDGEFTPTSVFRGLMASVQKQAPKLVLGIFLLGAG
jgi:chromosome segregation ATPase